MVSLTDTKIRNIQNSLYLFESLNIQLFKIYVYSILSIIGTLANLFSFIVFMSDRKNAPRIHSKKILCLLTLSNSIYLILFWYIFILPKIIKYLSKISTLNPSNKGQTNGSIILSASFLDMEKYYLINSNMWMCKCMFYFYKVFLFINSSMTVIFSIERALAINFPINMRIIREKHRFLFKNCITIVVAYCFLYPTYYLYLLNIINTHNGQQCRIQNESLYFKLTILFVFQTLAIPFILISISNISILVGIKRHRRNFSQRIISYNPSNTLVNVGPRVSYSHVSSSMKMHITKTLITISASFVLLRLPYLIAWCRFVLFKIYNSKPFDEDQKKELRKRNEIVEYAQILNLFNYALTGLLYFVAGNNFRKNLKKSLRNFLQLIMCRLE
jgi:hypothetical protein